MSVGTIVLLVGLVVGTGALVAVAVHASQRTVAAMRDAQACIARLAAPAATLQATTEITRTEGAAVEQRLDELREARAARAGARAALR